jgi:CO dehydrogenase nickel-insertion accessory protein CooC1
MSDRMMDLLGNLSDKVIGTVPYVTDLVKAALSGHPIDEHLAAKHVDPIVQRLEAIASQCA